MDIVLLLCLLLIIIFNLWFQFFRIKLKVFILMIRLAYYKGYFVLHFVTLNKLNIFYLFCLWFRYFNIDNCFILLLNVIIWVKNQFFILHFVLIKNNIPYWYYLFFKKYLYQINICCLVANKKANMHFGINFLTFMLIVSIFFDFIDIYALQLYIFKLWKSDFCNPNTFFFLNIEV